MEEEYSKVKILLVDDQVENIDLAKIILKRKNFQLFTAENGAHAIQIASEETPDLILLDINMPGMDGFCVCETLKSAPGTKEIPIIFVTAHSSNKSILKGFHLGAVDYITKPFNHAELRARVETHLELKFNRDRLEKMALQDSLTGLYNHRCIMERIDEEISALNRRNFQLSLIMLDIDHFKKVNDTYGHQFGDEVLVKITQTLTNSFRKEDIIGRYGGEEFIVILPNTNLEQAMLAGEKVRSNVAGIVWEKKNFSITISSGVTLLLQGERAGDFIKRVDEYLYKAKNRGRNQVVSDED